MIKRNLPLLRIDNDERLELTEECYDSVVQDVAETLIKYVIQTGEIIQYGELCKLMKYPINPRNLDRPLGIISDTCLVNGLPPISVMVVNKNSCIPGAGFFRYFYPGLKESEWDSKFIELYNQVKEYDNWEKVLSSFSSSDIRD